MKKNIVITLALLVFCGCDDGANFYDGEIVVNKDCTTGSEFAGVEFDSDSIRCGRKSNVYFGLDGDETTIRSLFLFYDSDAQMILFGFWRQILLSWLIVKSLNILMKCCLDSSA